MRKNMGNIDRIARVIISIIIGVLFLTDVIHGTIGISLIVLSGIFLLTSVSSFCPLYTLVGMSTCSYESKE
ncbi:DUF2892 domain-containing protein [Algivirga pacifica]|uniref:YgaP family membrane protein n=1 Tax=Algivirga pacifica TaxID=1162670 RepID=UPI0031E700F1